MTRPPKSVMKAIGQRRMRGKILLGSGALLSIALVLAAYGVLATYDYNTLKPLVARMVRDATGRELRIGGDVEFAIGPSPLLVVSDIAFANAAWGAEPQMVTIRSLRFKVRLLPLILKKVIIDQVGLSGVRLLLERGPDGQPNWDLPARKSTGGLETLKAAKIAVDRLRITDLDIVVLRPPGASKAQFTLARLAMNRQGAQERLALSLRADYSGQAVALDGVIGSIDLLVKRRPFPVQLTAKSSHATVVVSGSIAAIHDLAGVDMNLKASGQDLREIGKLIGQTLPLTDDFALEGRLTGAAKTLSIEDAQGSARRGNLRLTLKGAVADLLALRGLDLSTRLSGEDLTAFGEMIGVNLPATDEFDIEGRLSGSSAKLALQAARAHAVRGGMRLSLTGTVEDLPALEGLDLSTRLTGEDLTSFGEMIGVNLPATDEFKIEGRLSGSSAKLALQAAKAHAVRGGMRLSLAGAVEDLLTFEGMGLQIHLAGRELAEIGPLLGTTLPDLGPFDVKSRLAGSFNAIALKPFSAVIDKSDFNGWTTVSFSKRPKITLRLISSLIDFTALMKSFEVDAPKPVEDHKRPHRLFPDDPLPAEVLSKIDADILLKATNIQARHARLKSGHLTLKLEDNDLRIDKLEATYKGTKISANLHLKRDEMLEAATSLLVQNFNLGDFLKETGKSDEVRAIIDIAAHGKSRGDSVNRLMANLDGAVGAVMGEGYLTKYLDILSVGLSDEVVKFWDPPKAVNQVKCAVVQFDIKKGMAASQAFVFDTRAGIIDGEGQIDLDTEKINFLLVPKSKHLELSIRPKLRISGTIMEPQVHIDKLSLLIKGASALSALVIGPLGLLAPFVHLGALNAHSCDVSGIGQGGLSFPESE